MGRPACLGNQYLEIGTPVANPASVSTETASTTVSQPDITELASVGRKYGIDFLN
ncbi:MAG: hypothetical protein AAGF01_06460 [Cyanobacteria bacterium P01_G01_bin.38]